MRKYILVLAIALSACAADVQDYAEKFGEEVTEFVEQTQALNGPWQAGAMFNEVSVDPFGYTATSPSWLWFTMSQPNTEYRVFGDVYSGDDGTRTLSYVYWSLNIGTYPNGCVTQGCSFVLCGENRSRGWGTCTAVQGQGTTSSNPEMHGWTAFFAGLRLGGHEQWRWTMYVTTSGYWPNLVSINDFTVSAYN